MARCAGIGHVICQSLLNIPGMAVIGLDKEPLEKGSPLATHKLFQSRIASILDHEAVYDAVADALSSLGRDKISVVVNNAGIAQPYMQGMNEDVSLDRKSYIAMRLQEFDAYVNTNLRGAFLVTEVCKQWFSSEVKPSIIHISSTRARQSEAGKDRQQHGYAAAKAGLTGLMHAQGQSLSGEARVNAIVLGWIDTSGYEITEQDREWHAAGRVGHPQDVANLVVFLADEEKSGFITCQEFVVDGGATAKMFYPE